MISSQVSTVTWKPSMITFAIPELDIFESLSRICVVTSIKICCLEIEVYIENEGWRKESGFERPA
jgi:hypothetical protein